MTKKAALGTSKPRPGKKIETESAEGIFFSFFGYFNTFVFVWICMLFLSSAAFALPLVSLEDLSDHSLSPEGKTALSFLGEAALHAETDHFIYHFTDEKQAETAFVKSEVYYAWVKEIFGVMEDSWKKKGHVFIFDDEEKWGQFNQRVNQGKIPSAHGFTNGWELFFYRDPHWLAPQKILAHEMTHLITFRFLDGKLPLFLNEGFAEFMAYKALAMQVDGNEYNLRTVQLLKGEEWIPLEKLAASKDYPASGIEAFYRESELLVRYLLTQYDRPRFYRLLKETSSGTAFDRALEEIYATSLPDFEEKFKKFAVTV